ncbi:MAG: hypothetical protein EFKGCFLK_02717 [Rhodocyclaceae bacterium]|nr:DUF1972 domain-containing protein [Zoogloeaceae bacterium]MBV6409094.1 hypothetical protein [Rhodocyclaceae bacterium]
MRSISILGTRGVPARYGGFETFAEALALYLEGRGWRVTVYCHDEGGGRRRQEIWHGVELVHLPSRLRGAAGTVEFDLKCTWDALRRGNCVNLVLGYNTAVFSLFYRLAGQCNIINMDGLEWRRSKWSRPVRGWFYVNEWLGCWLGNRLVADHPEIARHLASRGVGKKVTMIPYGSEPVRSADPALLGQFGLSAGGYVLLVARAEPENSILEIVSAFSARPRGVKLAVLGAYDRQVYQYHDQVMDAASQEVMFLGPVYDRTLLGALRFHALAYCHGHRVGGTNPSLLEAMGAGNAVLAHDNAFNRWVAGDGALFFSNEAECAAGLDTLLADTALRARAGEASRARHAAMFTWPEVLESYERLLLECCGAKSADATRR